MDSRHYLSIVYLHKENSTQGKYKNTRKSKKSRSLPTLGQFISLKPSVQYVCWASDFYSKLISVSILTLLTFNQYFHTYLTQNICCSTKWSHFSFPKAFSVPLMSLKTVHLLTTFDSVHFLIKNGLIMLLLR